MPTPSEPQQPGPRSRDRGWAVTRRCRWHRAARPAVERVGGAVRVGHPLRVIAVLTVAPPVVEAVADRVADLARRPQHAAVIAIAEDLAAPADHAVDASRDRGREPLHATRDAD